MTQPNVSRWILHDLSTDVMNGDGRTVAALVDSDVAMRRALVRCALAVVGAIGAELTQRGVTTMHELPLPRDTPDVVCEKTLMLMQRLDKTLNAQENTSDA